MAVGTQALEDSASRRATDLLSSIIVGDIFRNMLVVGRKFSIANPSDERVKRAYEFCDISAYSFTDRLKIRAADLLFYSVTKLLGMTARYDVSGWDNHDRATQNGGIPIYCMWHDRMFLATYWWRNRGIILMSSLSFDGEYTNRFIKRFGYGAIRGSSTRGGVGALVEMARMMRAGYPTGFTIDGPKGPRYVVKTGAVVLAKKTGNPLVPVSMGMKRYWTLPTWDRFQVAKPFTRAPVFVGPAIYVSRDATDDELKAKRDELQKALEDLTREADEWSSQGKMSDTV